MCLSMDISIWKINKFFALSLWEIVWQSRLIILIGRFTLFGLNRRYLVLFGLTDIDNLFDVILENTAPIQDSFGEKANKASSGEKDK